MPAHVGGIAVNNRFGNIDRWCAIHLPAGRTWLVGIGGYVDFPDGRVDGEQRFQLRRSRFGNAERIVADGGEIDRGWRHNRRSVTTEFTLDRKFRQRLGEQRAGFFVIAKYPVTDRQHAQRIEAEHLICGQILVWNPRPLPDRRQAFGIGQIGGSQRVGTACQHGRNFAGGRVTAIEFRPVFGRQRAPFDAPGLQIQFAQTL
ncbi:MAG TPA: hypothetical protein PKY50_02350 [Candidatus Competibacter sp.]|nr:hypothetical protein [Candidatus Competibacter sp.]